MISLYIHIPFCVSKCHYCDFNSVGIGRAAAPEDAYVQALEAEIGRWAGALGPEGRRGIATFFFGGGTPSLFQPASIGKILTRARDLAPALPEAECSLELNPKTADREKMTGFREAGCNRLSIGVQSLDEGLLTDLARAHTASDALRAIEWALDADFEKLSVDLMYGLPRQSLVQVTETLRRLEKYPLKHLSAYELIVEEGTPFFEREREGRLPLPESDEVLEMRDLIEAFAAGRGLRPYEISNYSAEGCESRHNLRYWNYDSFVGIGAGAVSYLKKSQLTAETLRSLGVEDRPELYGLRLTNPRGLQEYQTGAGDWRKVSVETIDLDLAQGEYMMMGLRKRSGVRFREFEEKLELPFPEAFAEKIAEFAAKGWLRRYDLGCRLTESGTLWSNEVMQAFY